jgi:hypothetical protein
MRPKDGPWSIRVIWPAPSPLSAPEVLRGMAPRSTPAYGRS